MERIILFDGVCNLCSHSVQFILKRDPEGKFKFASIQSETGQRLLKTHGLPSNINSFLLFEEEQVFIKSSAALKVCKQLKGRWKLLTFFQIIPLPIRDYLYQVIADNRYKWFGKNDGCLLPMPEWKNRFLS